MHVSNLPIGAMGNSQVAATRTCTSPLMKLSPICCTTPNEPGLMFSTRRRLEELACASSTTEPATAASRTTLLVMLSSAFSMYVPGARTMRSTPVLASAHVRPALVLTVVCSSRRWLGTSCMENSPGMSLASVQGSTVHESGGGDNMGNDGGGWDGIRKCGGVGIGDSGMGGGGAEDEGGVGPESGMASTIVERAPAACVFASAVPVSMSATGHQRSSEVIREPSESHQRAIKRQQKSSEVTAHLSQRAPREQVRHPP
jgi:hypothetical protein